MIAVYGDLSLLLRVFSRKLSPGRDAIRIAATAIPDAEIVAIFRDDADDGEVPHTIVVDRRPLRDFFAWASTYLSHWSPLTSRVRVLERSQWAQWLSQVPMPARFPPYINRAFASLVVGELMCDLPIVGDKLNLSLLAARGTFGYAAVGALLKGRLDLHALFTAWEGARRLLHVRLPDVDRRSLLNVWEPIVELLSEHGKSEFRSGAIGQALKDVVAAKRLPADPSFGGAPLFEEFCTTEGTNRREDAVVELERWLAQRRPTNTGDKFFTACLAARLSQAPLTHFDVLARMTRQDAESLLWYAFISGVLSSEPSIPPVERLLFRLSGDFDMHVEACRADILIDELGVLVRPDGVLQPSVQNGYDDLSVDLGFGICSVLQLHTSGVKSPVGGSQRADAWRDQARFDNLLIELRELYDRKGTPVRKRARK